MLFYRNFLARSIGTILKNKGDNTDKHLFLFGGAPPFTSDMARLYASMVTEATCELSWIIVALGREKIMIINKITSVEKLVYRKAAEWIIRNYDAIKLMDPESIHTFQSSSNFIQGFVYRCLRSSSKELLDKIMTGMASGYISISPQ